MTGPGAGARPEIDDPGLYDLNQTLQVRSLAALMVYISGRLDAADRRAGLVLSGAAVALSLFAARLSGVEPDPGVAGRVAMIAMQPSVWLALVAVALALSALWPRKAVADDWVSQIFLGTAAPETIHARLSGSEAAIVTGFIANQQALAGLVRRKNRLVAWSIPPLLTSILAFALGY